MTQAEMQTEESNIVVLRDEMKDRHDDLLLIDGANPATEGGDTDVSEAPVDETPLHPPTTEGPIVNEAVEEEEEEESEEEKKAVNKSARTKKILLALLLVGFVVFIIVDSTTNGYVMDGVRIFLEWIEENPEAGVFAFIGVYFAATILFIPGSLLTLGSGFVFASAFGLGLGIVLGTLVVFVGASAGALVAFLLGRYLLRDWVEHLTEKYAIFEALDKALEDKGFRIMALLRLSPILPFNVLNYIAGITGISFRDYMWALIAILPGTILYVFLGATAGSLTDSEAMGDDNVVVTVVVVVVGIVFGILGIVATSFYAKKELNKVLARQQEAEASEETEEADSLDNV